MKRMAFVSALLLLVAPLLLASGKKGKEKDQLSDLSFTVVKDSNGKPVRNASVVLHPVNKEGKQEAGGLQLKTDADGKAAYNSIPYGKLRVQVIASGFQTFGQDYDINQPTQEIVIKLQRPKDQYTIYK